MPRGLLSGERSVCPLAKLRGFGSAESSPSDLLDLRIGNRPGLDARIASSSASRPNEMDVDRFMAALLTVFTAGPLTQWPES